MPHAMPHAMPHPTRLDPATSAVLVVDVQEKLMVKIPGADAIVRNIGFLLDAASVESIVSGVGRAIAAFRHPRFGTVRRRVMRLDVSWDRPGRRYAQLYRQLTQVEPTAAAASAAVNEGA